MRKAYLAIAAPLLLGALLLASHGGGTAIKVGRAGNLGRVIVNSSGLTLYDFHRDRGTRSSCYGACARAWPPLLTRGRPKAEGRAEGSLLGTTRRKDGTLQVTYDGHPLYRYFSDRRPGEANGNGSTAFGGAWRALRPNGREAGARTRGGQYRFSAQGR